MVSIPLYINRVVVYLLPTSPASGRGWQGKVRTTAWNNPSGFCYTLVIWFVLLFLTTSSVPSAWEPALRGVLTLRDFY